MTSSGAIEVEAPRVDDRREGGRFSSAILPTGARRSPKVTEVLRVLYLGGLHQGLRAGAGRLRRQRGEPVGIDDLAPHPGVERGPGAVQAPGPPQGRLRLRLGRRGPLQLPLEEARLCCLVLVGGRADRRKELIAVGGGFRESEDSWSELLRDLKRRGMRAPVLGIGDGALGFWAALREVFPETKEQRCWVHKIANCLDVVPKSIHPKVKAALLADPETKVLQVNVETFKGVVQLSGFVSSQGIASRAVELTRGVKGVNEVKNDMRLR